MAAATQLPEWNTLMRNASELDRYTSSNKIATLNDLLNTYVKSAGTDANTSQRLIEIRTELDGKLAAYDGLIENMKRHISAAENDSDVTAKLSKIGALREKIAALHEELKVVEEDKNTSDARREAVERATTSVSYEQLYGGLSRPLHTISIPILATISVLFFVIGFLVVYRFVAVEGGAAILAQKSNFNIKWGQSIKPVV